MIEPNTDVGRHNKQRQVMNEAGVHKSVQLFACSFTFL